MSIVEDFGRRTEQDDKDTKNCVVPESFRNVNGKSELNGKGYELIGRLVYNRMDRLVYFNEIHSELCIDESIKEIQKNDSD